MREGGARALLRRRAGANGWRGGERDTSPASRLGALAGALDSGSAVAAVEALRGVLWDALLDELGWSISDRSSARLIADLADRLALVCSMALTATLTQLSPAPDSEGEVPAAALLEEDSEHRGVAHQGAANEPARPAATRRPAILVDECEQALGDRSRAATPQIEIRDVRGEEGPAAWIGSIGRRLERYEQDGSPFAVLLVELVDVERLQSGRARGGDVPAESRGARTRSRESCARPIRSRASARAGTGCWRRRPTGSRRAGWRSGSQRAVRSSASHRGTPWRWRWASPCVPRMGGRPQSWPRTRMWTSTPPAPLADPRSGSSERSINARQPRDGAAGEGGAGETGGWPEGRRVGDGADDDGGDADGLFDPERLRGGRGQVPVGAVGIGAAVDDRQVRRWPW